MTGDGFNKGANVIRPGSTMSEDPEMLMREAERYFQEALRQKDLRQMAEKAHLSATLAADALILSMGWEKPKSLFARKRALESISIEEAKTYTLIVDDLHRDCFYDGLCHSETIKRRMEDVKEFNGRIRKQLTAKNLNP